MLATAYAIMTVNCPFERRVKSMIIKTIKTIIHFFFLISGVTFSILPSPPDVTESRRTCFYLSNTLSALKLLVNISKP